MAVHSKDLPQQINSVLDAVHTRKSSAPRPLPAVALVGFIAIFVGRYLSNKQAKAKKAEAAASKVSSEGSSSVLESLEAKVLSPKKTTRAIKHTSPETFERNRKFFPPSKVAAAGSSASSAKSSVKVGVNKEFFRQIEAIFKILIPKLHCKETFILVLHTTFLVLRTYLSVVVARLDGDIVKDLIAGNGKGFIRGLGYWFAIALPATYTNSMIRYLQSKLSIAFRTRLTRYVHDLYLNDQITYYKALNLDDRIQGVDQYITTDVAKFCDSLAGLYSNLGKPLLDTIIFNYQLMRSIGVSGMGGLFVSYVVTAFLLRMVTPAFGKLAAVEAKLEGDFRSAHTRLITNAEEVAFYNGAELEHSILTRTYKRLIRHINSIYKIRIAYNMFEDFIIKYCWSAVGLTLCALPVFFPALGGVDSVKDIANGDKVVGARTKGFITSKRLMMSLADAGGRMMYSYKEMSELAGSTLRVYNLISVLHQLQAGQYEGVDLKTANSAASSEDGSGDEKELYSLSDIRGRIEYGYEGIRFVGVPIVTPSPGNANGGEELVRGLNVDVRPGDHMLVTGPNGVGKTGFARLVSGLWPVFRGELARPNPKDIFYIPQRAYLSIGSLRDQVIYPHSHADMIKAGRTDEELMTILKHVHLAYIPDREGGWDTVKEWKDVFSGGEKQRMNMARLFYHKPKFAILDECTSAVSSDVEGLMYNHAKDVGITLITISHRPALFKYHLHLLKLTGDHGHWEFSTIGTAEERQSLEKEMASLQAKLDEVEDLKKRHAEIQKELEVGLNAGPVDGTKVQKRGLF
ncbi:ATP-binding cassette, subfamily D (ALD), peroxisomal long-chain fatty acid import protein [Entomortierella parvispora]|uniref:ATP-binding cassette, subfamily D (ALD), peroxisomal long-chain fatty acid import protein n=1 Tax=Entomortierella parvispora TaxID=205924 RepID=A0A9P3H2B0_9FUNG|nr:ATP-binding cassette, subfamily D (ALD), peroxisomal long-chain fatty acid import protein [Entomortierella parvispora]